MKTTKTALLKKAITSITIVMMLVVSFAFISKNEAKKINSKPEYSVVVDRSVSDYAAFPNSGSSNSAINFVKDDKTTNSNTSSTRNNTTGNSNYNSSTTKSNKNSYRDNKYYYIWSSCSTQEDGNHPVVLHYFISDVIFADENDYKNTTGAFYNQMIISYNSYINARNGYKSSGYQSYNEANNARRDAIAKRESSNDYKIHYVRW